jgi:2-oxoglutarate ferredoxin oxidoreductase subunit alpha
MSDLDLGMNNWMSEPFQYPDQPWDRGKVLTEEQLAALPRFERYRDVDGDGIPYRTLPGNRDAKGTYFTRGSGHDEAARYTENAEAYARGLDRLARKLDTARTMVPPPEIFATGSEIGIVAFGSSHWAVVEARDQLADAGVKTDYLLLKALPGAPALAEFLRAHPRVYVVEQNRDGQLAGILRGEYADVAPRIRSVRHYDGLPIDARSVSDEILRQEGMHVPAAEGAAV